MSSINNIEKLYVKYFSGQTTEEEVQAIHTYLNQSATKRADFEQLRNLWEVAHPAFDPTLIDTEKANQKMIAEIRKPEVVEQSLPNKLFPLWLRIAASIVIPLILILFFVHREVYQPIIYANAVWEEVISPVNEVTQIILDDGTKVTLNTGSRLTYPKVFVGKQRNVRLEGEAYFEVVKNASKPLVVYTKRMNIEVLGTKFNVNAYTDLSEVKTTLEEGKVKVSIPNVNNMDDSFYLMPNEELTLHVTTGDIIKRQVNATESQSWMKGGLIFSSTLLEDALKQIARKYKVSIEARPASVADKRLTVRFDKGENLDQILSGLQIMMPEFVIKQQSDSHFILVVNE